MKNDLDKQSVSTCRSGLMYLPGVSSTLAAIWRGSAHGGPGNAAAWEIPG